MAGVGVGVMGVCVEAQVGVAKLSLSFFISQTSTRQQSTTRMVLPHHLPVTSALAASPSIPSSSYSPSPLCWSSLPRTLGRGWRVSCGLQSPTRHQRQSVAHSCPTKGTKGRWVDALGFSDNSEFLPCRLTPCSPRESDSRAWTWIRCALPIPMKRVKNSNETDKVAMENVCTARCVYLQDQQPCYRC